MQEVTGKLIFVKILAFFSTLNLGDIFTTNKVCDYVSVELTGETMSERVGPASSGVWGDIRDLTQDALFLLGYGSRSGMGKQSGTSCPIIKRKSEAKRLFRIYEIDCLGESDNERQEKRDALCPLFARMWAKGKGSPVPSTFVFGQK